MNIIMTRLILVQGHPYCRPLFLNWISGAIEKMAKLKFFLTFLLFKKQIYQNQIMNIFIKKPNKQIFVQS